MLIINNPYRIISMIIIINLINIFFTDLLTTLLFDDTISIVTYETHFKNKGVKTMKALFTIYKKDITGIQPIEAVEASQERGVQWIKDYMQLNNLKVLKRKNYMTIKQLQQAPFQFAYDILVADK